MSIIHVNQIIGKVKPLFESYVDMSDIKETDPERDVKLTTRCLAAYAVYQHTACSPEDAAKSIVDGGEDNGLDAVYYSSTLKELVLVQSKFIRDGSGEPASAEVAKFCNGIEALINMQFDRFNKRVHDRQAEIQTAISAFDTKYVLILIYTGDKGLAIHSQRLVDDLLQKLNDVGESSVKDIVKFQKFDQAKIYNSLSQGLLQDPINIEIGLHQFGKVEHPFMAFFGYVSGEELLKLWQEHGRKLFHKNIRNVLGKTDVNEELSLTVQQTPEKFWYFNNGVTIIADSIEKSMIGGTNNILGSFKLINASVVNGAQTISSIGEIGPSNLENLKKVYVLVRCISLHDAPSQFGNEVTKANNRQNRIENRDFVSQDPEQNRLREELAHDGITYSIVRTDAFVKSKQSFEVEEATISLACASKNVALAVQAKRELGKFYEDLSKGIYKSIFNPSVTSRYVYNCVEINRQIEKLIEAKVKAMGRKTGKEYGILIHGNRFLSMLVFKQISVSATTIVDISAFNLSSIVDQAFNKIVGIVNSRYSDAILGTLFKNKAKCEEIENLM